MIIFEDRSDAGRRLAARLTKYAGGEDVLVLALPRGGVAVGLEVALALHVPMDIILVRKLGVPGYEELAMGAITANGVRVLNENVVRSLNITREMIDEVVAREQTEVSRREHEYRQGRPAPKLEGKTVILVDDGLATGASMRAAVTAVRGQKPGKVVVAVPTGAAETCAEFRRLADEVICYVTPAPFFGVGAWYRDFRQMTDEEVKELLGRANPEVAGKK